MKKSIITAGAASVVLAAMPVLGVFAADDLEVVDTLTMQISSSCTFDTADASFNVATPLLTNETASFTGRGSANETELKVYCNKASYTVAAAFTSLNGYTENTYTTTNNDAITYDAAAPTGGSGTWAAYRESGRVGTTDASAGYLTAGTIMSSSNVTGNDSVNYDNAVISYSVSSGSHKAGYYKGTATYTLTATE